MSAPQTPPPGPPPYDPWQAEAGGRQPDVPRDEPGRKRSGGVAELRGAALAALALTVAGVLLGLLWLWLAPRVPLVSDGEAVYLKDSEGEQAIGVDGTFVLLGLAFGLVSAVVVFLSRRRGGVGMVVGLVVGGVLGSLVAWRLGVWLGPSQDVVAHAKSVGKDVVFDAPLELAAKGALLAWPLAACAVHLLLTAAFGPRDTPPLPAGPWAGGPQWTTTGPPPENDDTPDPSTAPNPNPNPSPNPHGAPQQDERPGQDEPHGRTERPGAPGQGPGAQGS